MQKLNDVTNIVSKLRILRVAQLSELWGVSSTTIWRWRQDSNFPKPVALGPRMVGWKITDLETWLDSNQLAA